MMKQDQTMGCLSGTNAFLRKTHAFIAFFRFIAFLFHCFLEMQAQESTSNLPETSLVIFTAERSQVSEEEDFTDTYIHPDEPLPCISPRDRLSYQDDKKAWKELEKYKQDNPQLGKLLFVMRMDIMRAKPADVVGFLVEEFFTETKQIEVRRRIGIKS